MIVYFTPVSKTHPTIQRLTIKDNQVMFSIILVLPTPTTNILLTILTMIHMIRPTTIILMTKHTTHRTIHMSTTMILMTKHTTHRMIRMSMLILTMILTATIKNQIAKTHRVQHILSTDTPYLIFRISSHSMASLCLNPILTQNPNILI